MRPSGSRRWSRNRRAGPASGSSSHRCKGREHSHGVAQAAGAHSSQLPSHSILHWPTHGSALGIVSILPPRTMPPAISSPDRRGTMYLPTRWRIWAMANQMSGDLAEAKRTWQKLLDQQPKDPSTRNNLAYALLLEGGPERLRERSRWPPKRSQGDPNAATFYDTLARMKPDSAIRPAPPQLPHALEKDPEDIEAMIGLADELQVATPGRDEARSLLGRINTRIDAGMPLMQPIRKQLEHVKTALEPSADPGE